MASGAETGIKHGTAEFMLHPFKKKKKWLGLLVILQITKNCRR